MSAERIIASRRSLKFIVVLGGGTGGSGGGGSGDLIITEDGLNAITAENSSPLQTET